MNLDFLCRSPFSFRGGWLISWKTFLVFLFLEFPVFSANSEDLDQTPHSVDLWANLLCKSIPFKVMIEINERFAPVAMFIFISKLLTYEHVKWFLSFFFSSEEQKVVHPNNKKNQVQQKQSYLNLAHSVCKIHFNLGWAKSRVTGNPQHCNNS